MPRTDEAEWWINAVYETAQLIPHGRVTTYGHIASLLGQRKSTHFYLREIPYIC